MSKIFSLQDRVAIVTGGAGGIGLALAHGLAEAGADVAIFDIVTPSADDLTNLALYGTRVQAYNVDVSSIESLSSGFDAVKDAFDGRLDILVTCAGIFRESPFLDVGLSDFQSLFQVNCQGTYFSAQLAARAMIASGTKHGSIIFISSVTASVAARGVNSTAYSGTKGAVRTLAAPIASELRDHNIRVNSISPGHTDTAMAGSVTGVEEKFKDGIMLHRFAQPQELQGACVFLASDASSFCTGTDIVVDGGFTKW